ncbi:hypothetical protein Tco_1048857 [Tanacetum coccineum]
MRFVSKADDYQMYRALLPEVMTNQKMQTSSAYKTYLALATGAATPKKARKFKKHASPSKKKTLIIIEEPEPAKRVVPSKKPSRKQSTSVQIRDTPGVSVSKKKAPAITDRTKGIDLLYEAALFEEVQVPDEPKGKSVDTHKGTGLKPGVLDQDDEEDALESDDDLQQADDERTDLENQMINDEDKESEDAFVHTPEDYVPTNDETNDETKDVDKEEYERISEELYGDVNVKLTNVVHYDEEKGDADMTNAAHVQVEQTQEQTMDVQEESGPEMASIQGRYVEQVTTTTTPAIQNATTEVPPLSSSHSISSTYTNAFLNLKNLYSTETEVVSMMDINVQHEVPHTSLLIIPVSVIPEHTIVHPSETVTTAPATTITSLLSITDLEKDVKELKNVDNSTTVISTIKSDVPNAVKEYLGSSLDDALYKMIQKHSPDIIKEHTITAEIVKRLKQQYAPQKKSILDDEDTMDKGVADELKKRKPNDADKDEVPTTGSDRGLKRQRTSKGTETSKKTSTSKDSSKGKSQTTFSKSGKSAKEQVEEPIFVQDSGYAKHDDDEFDNTDMPMDQEEDLGKLMNNPTTRLFPNKPKGHRCPYDLNKPLPVKMLSQGYQIVPVYFFFNKDLEYLREWSNEKKYTVSTTKSKAAWYELKGIEDMVPNLWSLHDVYLTKRILSIISVKVVEWYGYSHLEEIVVKRADQNLYTFKEGDFKRLHLNDIEYMLLLVVQNKLHSLDTNVVVHLAVKLRTNEEEAMDQIRSAKDPHHDHSHQSKVLDRRIMGSLEKFVGGRDYGEDLRLLQRTI